MTRSMFLLFAVGYYVVTMVIIVIVLLIINRHNRKKYINLINELEREKNLIISASIMSELNKVEALVNNDDLKRQYENWKDRFNEIKDVDIPKITDSINEVQKNFEEKDYVALKTALIESEMDLNFLKTKADYLLEEIRKITLSEEMNREKITKLKADYRAIMSNYNDNPNDFVKVKTSLDLQFENVDKLFSSFEAAMDKNAYTEVGKIVKAIDNVIANLNAVISETKTICQYGEVLIPKKVEDVKSIANRMIKDGYNLDYLNLDYNVEESDKKLQDIEAYVYALGDNLGTVLQATLKMGNESETIAQKNTPQNQIIGEVDTTNAEIGMVLKNYNALCCLLNEKPAPSGSNSRKAQKKRFDRYLKLEKGRGQVLFL